MEPTGVNWPDIVIIAVILISVMIGVLRGLIQESISLITWIGAIVVGVMFTSNLTPYVTFTEVAFIKSLTAFMVLFVLTVFLGALVNFFVGKLIRKTPFSIPDRVLGSLFGLFRGVFIVTIAVLLSGLTPLTQSETWQKSYTIQEFEKVAVWIKDRLPTRFSEPFKFDDEENKAVDDKDVSAPVNEDEVLKEQ